MIPTTRTVRFVIAILITTIFVANGDGTKAAQPSPESKQRNTLIPYKVLHREEMGDQKLSIDVRVDLVDGRLPTKAELGAISMQLVKGQRHKRKFVGFYLPGMKIDAGSFATAHHLPNLEVKILEFNLPDKYRNLLKK
jgi:hypothetical protein